MEPTSRIPQASPSSVHPHPISLPLADVNLIDRHLLGAIILLAFTTLTCLIGLRNGPSLGDHEALNALAARDAIQNGRWLIPNPGDEPRIRKTPLGIWAIAATSKIVQAPGEKPVTTFTARLPSAIAAMITVMAVYWLGAMLFGHRAGLVAGFIAASCTATLYFARNAQADQLLTMLTALSFAFFWRGALHSAPSRLFMAAFFACFALAMMAKAPLPLVTVGLSLAVYWFFTLPFVEALERSPLPKGGARRWSEAMGRRIRGLRNLWLLPGISLFLVVAGAWPLYVYLKVDHALDLWRIEYLARYSGELSEKVQPFWYYIPLLFALTFPFLASLPEAVAAIFLPRYAAHRRGLGFVFTWAFVTTVFLSTAAFKRPHYLASVIPAFCLLLAPVIDRLFFGTLFASKRALRMFCGVLPFLIGGLWALGAWYGQREYPEIGRNIAIALGAAAILWIAASLAFCAHCRRSAFALLLCSMPVMLAISAPAIGKTVSVNREADELARLMREHGIEKSVDIYWADGRPNAAIEFYTGLPVHRLMDMMEMAAVRDGRQAVSSELQEMMVGRIKERLSDPKPAIFIMSRKYFDRLVASGEIPHRIVFEINNIDPNSKNALVVFTQPPD